MSKFTSNYGVFVHRRGRAHHSVQSSNLHGPQEGRVAVLKDNACHLEFLQMHDVPKYGTGVALCVLI